MILYIPRTLCLSDWETSAKCSLKTVSIKVTGNCPQNWLLDILGPERWVKIQCAAVCVEMFVRFRQSDRVLFCVMIRWQSDGVLFCVMIDAKASEGPSLWEDRAAGCGSNCGHAVWIWRGSLPRNPGALWQGQCSFIPLLAFEKSRPSLSLHITRFVFFLIRENLFWRWS